MIKSPYVHPWGHGYIICHSDQSGVPIDTVLAYSVAEGSFVTK